MKHWKAYVLSALLLGLPGFSSGVLAQGEDDLEDLIGSVVEEEDELERVETQIPGLEEEEALLGRVRLPRGDAPPHMLISQDRPIDPENYIIGPADVLQLYIWGEFDISYELKVDPEGHILIPTIGSFRITDMSLAQVREHIFAAAQKRYEDVPMTINLTSMRFFTIYITGAIAIEGATTVHPNMRISDVIDEAGGFVDELRGAIGKEIAGGKSVTQVRRLQSRETARRSVLVTHADDTADTLDLRMFQATGDLQHNPYILMGDRIHVKFLVDQVRLFGPFFGKTDMEWREGDTIGDLIALRGGIRTDDPMEYAEIWRWKNRSDDYEIIHLAGTIGSGERIELEDFADVPVHPKDQVYVRTINHWQYDPTISVQGEVRYSGRWRFHVGQTRVRDAIESAGGFTEDAALERARLVSPEYRNIADAELVRIKAVSKISKLRPEEKAYLKSKTIDRRGEMVVDFVALFEQGDESQNILLQGGDAIYIPRKQEVVKITGAFEDPGLVPYVPGMGIDYYFDTVGGFNRDAERGEARLIQASSGLRFEFDKDLIVEPNDEIWVPEKPYRDWWKITRDTIKLASEIALTVAVVLTRR